MAYKINVAHKGKTFKIETSEEELVGMSIGDKLKGDIIGEDLKGYELMITGTSDKAGFPGLPDVAGPNLKGILLDYGRGMKQKPKGEDEKNKRPKGLRLRKTIRGKEISQDTVQINTKVVKEGTKKFDTLISTPAEKK